MPISDAAKRSLLAREGGEPIVGLLTIDHPDIVGGPLHLATTEPGEDVISNSITFTGAYLTVDMASDDQGAPHLEAAIVNVNRVISQALESLLTPATAELQVVLFSEPDTPLREIVNLDIRDVKYNSVRLTATLSHFSWANEPWPMSRVTPQNFWSIFQ